MSNLLRWQAACCRILLLLTARLRNDVVAVLIVLALAVSGLLEPAGLSGFGPA